MYFLYLKFQASYQLLCLNSSVCVGSGREPKLFDSLIMDSQFTLVSAKKEDYSSTDMYNKDYNPNGESEVIHIVSVLVIHITKTCPCNIQRIFLVVKLKISLEKF